MTKPSFIWPLTYYYNFLISMFILCHHRIIPRAHTAGGDSLSVQSTRPRNKPRTADSNFPTILYVHLTLKLTSTCHSYISCPPPSHSPMSHYIVSSKPCSMTSRATRLLPNLLLSKPRPTARFARTMATTTTTPAAPEKCDWLVIIPDIEGALEHRMKIRP